jgi:hypothetical protein
VVLLRKTLPHLCKYAAAACKGVMLLGITMQNDVEYKLKTLQLLGSFQTLELSLKIYIAKSYDIIRKRLNGDFPYEYRYSDIENLPLGKLLQIFEKINVNKSLHKDIKVLAKDRNILAHKSLHFTHETLRNLLDLNIDDQINNYEKIEIELNKCLITMSEELENIFK